MYSANDGLKVYQSNTKYGTSPLLGGTHSGGGARNLTNHEKTEFKNVILSAQDNTGGVVKLTDMGSLIVKVVDLCWCCRSRLQCRQW